ncbi:DUF4115 domain-containing protein [Psychrobium sp. MM17-31]|uniref:RodZ domain-containing protein n=1 Tax=Psychrobium sp. MM17-31 TaxID=2917758 RepID=UPI001EF6A762|nr:RodZ domain-containing protein [Psychrobium sp. MM17-31]MCG7530180.1 DUF4115 domain-containing protein [Psychrobium sp. MM17-31]
MSNTDDTSQQNSEQSETQPSLGSVLLAARQAAGLSLDDAAQKLFLSKAVVQQLETDTVPESANALFFKGYVKSYATLVGLDCDEMIAHFRTQYHCDGDLKSMQTFSNRSKNNTHNNYLNLITFGVVTVILMAVIAWWWQRQAMNEMPVVVEETTTVALEPSPRLPIAPMATNAAMEIETINVESTFKFKQDCWVKITDATNAVVAIGIKKAGTSIDVIGVAPLEVILGAPTAVEITYQQQILDITPYISNETATFTLPLEQ